MLNNNVFPYVLNGMNIFSLSIPDSRFLSNGLSDTGKPNDLIWFGFMIEWSIDFPNNMASFKMRIYALPSTCTTAVADLPTGTLVISLYELWDNFTSHSSPFVDNSL